MKKLLALLLVLVMVIALVPTAVAAAEAGDTSSALTGAENPENPENPQNPENPENPENPQNPENPENPENPQNPENPENPHDGHMVTWKIDTASHTWYCLSCNVAITAAEPHSYNPTTHRCTVCGIPDSNYCNHTDTKYVSAGSEGHIQYCTNCSARLSSVEPHHAVGNECDLCGYDGLGCSHEHTRWDCNSEWHGLFCLDCHNCIKEGNHVGMDDGVCDECGYGASDPSHCDHKNTEYVSLGSKGHVKFCNDCLSEVGSVEPHSFDNATHKCTVCGSLDSSHCDHKNTVYVSSGSEGHLKLCTDCLTYLGDVEPHHRVGDVCDLCGYDKFDCTHEHATWHYSSEFHSLLCDDCYKLIDSGDHVGMDDGICDKCGYNAKTTHTIPAGTHVCTDPGCGYFTYCVDENKDCKCDICGNEFHASSSCKDINGTSHEWFCANCKKSVGKESHYDDDKDGKCDACGHKMSGGSTEKDPSLDNVPKTADVMAPVAILSGLMSVAAVFTKKRFF